MFTLTPPTDLAPQGPRAGGSHQATLKEDSRHLEDKPHRSTKQRAIGVVPSPTRHSVLGCSPHGRESGVSPFLLFFPSSHKKTDTYFSDISLKSTT